MRDGSGATSAPRNVRVDVGNAAPEPQIEAPTSNALFRVGQKITLTGSAASAEDDDQQQARERFRAEQGS